MHPRGDRLRWPPRPRGRSGKTRVSLATDEAPSPRQPNEHDESADSQQIGQSGPRKRIRQAHEDLAAGMQDTDCRSRAAEVVARAGRARKRRS